MDIMEKSQLKALIREEVEAYAKDDEQPQSLGSCQNIILIPTDYEDVFIRIHIGPRRTEHAGIQYGRGELFVVIGEDGFDYLENDDDEPEEDRFDEYVRVVEGEVDNVKDVIYKDFTIKDLVYKHYAIKDVDVCTEACYLLVAENWDAFSEELKRTGYIK